MVINTVKCFRCGGIATGHSIQEAINNIDHSVGLSRKIFCGNNYHQAVPVDSKTLLPVLENHRQCEYCGANKNEPPMTGNLKV